MQLANIPTLLADANLKAYYKFEETSGTDVTDSSSGGHTGTASNASILNNIGGVYGNKAVFASASSNKITITDHADLKPTGSFTIAAWVRTLTTGANQSIFQTMSINTNYAGIWFGITSANKIYGLVGKNTGTSASDYKDLQAGTAMCDGAWHHVVITNDGSTMNLYLDGKLDGTVGSSMNPAYAATNYVRVGSQNNAGTDSNFFNGDIDDLALWNGKALTQAEVCALYQQGIGPQFTDAITDTNTKLYLKFDETSGTDVTDSSGNSHTGTASATSILNNSLGMQGNRGVFTAASSNKVTFTDHADLKPTGAFSLSCWVRTTDNGSTYPILFQSCNLGTNQAGILIYLNPAGTFGLRVGRNTGNTLHTDYEDFGGSAINDGRWHHLGFTVDGSYIHAYVDGVHTQLAFAYYAGYNATNYVGLGYFKSTGADAQFYTGDVDEFVLVNGTVLTAAQIEKLAHGNQGTSLVNSGLTTNLKLHYKFDETTGTAITDSSGQSHDGSSTAASQALVINQTAYNNGQALRYAANTSMREAQGFVVNYSAQCSKTSVYGQRVGSPGGNIWITIEPDVGGLPSGTPITNGTSNTVSVNGISTSLGFTDFTFASNPTLIGGTKYWLVLYGDYNGDGSNYYTVGIQMSSVYSRGIYAIYNTSWTTYPDIDMAFRIYDDQIILNPYGKFGGRGVFVWANSTLITITDHTDLRPTGAYSVGGWFRSLSATTAQDIFSCLGNSGNIAGIQVGVTDGGKARTFTGKNSGTTANTDYKLIDGTTSVCDGLWHHIVATWDTTNLNLYVDGRLDNQAAWANAAAYQSPSYPYVSGERYSGANYNFVDGDLDDVFLFNGTALTQSQVMLLYRQPFTKILKVSGSAIGTIKKVSGSGTISINKVLSVPNF